MSNGHSFPRSRRLLNPAEYRRVFASNSRVSDRYWTFLYSSTEQSHMRLGMAVAKKHLKRAADRNRVKRLVRESFRTHDHAGTVDVVVLARPDCRQASNLELRTSLNTLWSRISRKCAS